MEKTLKMTISCTDQYCDKSCRFLQETDGLNTLVSDYECRLFHAGLLNEEDSEDKILRCWHCCFYEHQGIAVFTSNKEKDKKGEIQ